jgi:hypothetical protein
MKTQTIYILFALFALAGCSDEILNLPVPPVNSSGAGEAVALTLRFPNSGSPGTYAISSSDENKISHLYILSFTKGPGGYLTDTLKYHIAVKTDTIANFDVDGSGITKKINVKLKNMVDSQRLVIIANPPSSLTIPEAYYADKTVGDIVDLLEFNGGVWLNNSVNPDTTSFPMFGQMTKYEKFHSTVTTPVTDITFQMIRAVAKIDVGVDLYGTGDPALGFGSIFKIQRVYVYNASADGYIAPPDDFLVSPKNIQGADSVQINQVNLTSSGSRVSSFYHDFPASGNRLGNLVYIPESDTLKGTYKPAFLVIQATYYGVPYYYRIDFTQGNKYVPILRNHNYVINIIGVRTEGYATLAEAANAPVSRFGSLALDQADDIGLKEVISYNNEYYLAVSSKDLYVDWMGKTITVKVRTSFQGGWEASDLSGSATFARSANTVNRETVLDSVRFTISNNLTGLPQEYSFNIRAGMLTLPVKVTQSPGSNCYIVKPGATITIPLASAKVGGVDRTIGAYQYQVVWEDNGNVIVSHPIFAPTIFSVTATNVTGNAVVAVQNSSGENLYSWHIWVTDYNPDDLATQKSNNGFIFMDRNLGAGSAVATDAASYGLYYQWGRKDPFVPAMFPSDFYADTINTSVNYLDSAMRHPMAFYAVPLTSATYDWIGAGQNNSMWNTMDGGKGPYDPCPFGWRVPVAKDDASDSPWYGFTNNSRNGASYPLSGYLDAFSGQRYDNGTNGGVWSASARAQQASAFTFTTTAGSAQRGSKFRANAYPVRCVKDVR